MRVRTINIYSCDEKSLTGFWDRLSSGVLFKNIRVKTPKTIILIVVFVGVKCGLPRGGGGKSIDLKWLRKRIGPMKNTEKKDKQGS
jgi:hypothetical protein